MAIQPALFSDDLPDKAPDERAEPKVNGAEAARELLGYALRRVDEVAGPDPLRTVMADVYSLGALLRRAQAFADVRSLGQLLAEPDLAARVLREPGVGQGTAARWLETLERFVRLTMRKKAGAATIATVRARLLPRTPKGWYQRDRIPGGGKSRGLRDRRLLFFVDLLAIVEKAALRKSGEHALRDRTLLAFLCGSGLRIGEVRKLGWEGLQWEQGPEGKIFPIWAPVQRRGLDLLLPVHRIAWAPLLSLYKLYERSAGQTPHGPIFRSLQAPFLGLGEREVKYIVDGVLTTAGFRRVPLEDLRAAFADHLLNTQPVDELQLTERRFALLHRRRGYSTGNGWARRSAR